MQSAKSPFTGLNPYLMSFLQSPGSEESPSSFPSFHSDHLTHIKDFLNDILPPQYIALSEPSMQIQGRDFDETEFQKDSQIIPDVTIYKPQSGTSPNAGRAASPSLELLWEIEEVREWTSVVVRELRTAEHEKHGAAIVRIELLSPSNMLGRSFGESYRANRQKSILSNTKLLEIDYLHEFRSPVPNIPLYPQDEEAKAYNICLSQPNEKKTAVYFWGINESIPQIYIPLKGEDAIIFDFNQVYDFTWKKSRFWFYLDYQQDPPRMNSYRPNDQTLIRQIVKEIPLD